MKKLIKGVVIILSALQIMTFSACSSSKSAGMSVTNQDGATASYVGNAKGISDNEAVQNAAPGASSSTSSTADSANLTAAVSRKIVQSADMRLTTTTYDKSVASLESAVESCGGYVQASSTQGDGVSGSRNASFTVRVPTAKFSDFLDSVGNVGKVVSRSVKGEDITQNYLDTETRLTTLKTEHSRLLVLLDKATKMSDILEIEQKLSDIENNIETYTGELKKWDSLVDLSTVNITISELTKGTAPKPVTFSGEISSIFTQSVSALVTTVKVICYVIVAIIPFAVILGLVACIIFFFMRRRKKHEDKNSVDEKIIDSGDDKDSKS